MILSRNSEVERRRITAVEGRPAKGDAHLKPLMAGDMMVLLEIEYARGAGTALHSHRHESVCYVVKGRVSMVVGEETYTLGPGDVCRHPEGVLHSVEALEDALIIEIKSPAQPLEEFLS